MSYHVFNYVSASPPSGRQPSASFEANWRSTSDGTDEGAAAPHAQPSASPRTALRVTPQALPWLVYAILHTIAFHAPAGPRPPASRSSGSGLAATGPASVAEAATSAYAAFSSFLGRHVDLLVRQAGHAPPTEQRAVADTAAVADTTRRATETDEAFALRRQRTQPLVVPVVQVLHQFGGMHIVVCEQRNRTLSVAYERAMEDVDLLVRAKAARDVYREASPVYPRASSQPRAAALSSSSAPFSPAPSETSGELAGTPVVRSGSPSPMSPLRADEVGMELSVRVLSCESRWRTLHRRPLAVWTFPVIRTDDERTVIAASSPPHAAARVIFANDPAQLQDVIGFISTTFYDAISLETFADYTSGELEFDVQVRGRNPTEAR